MMMLLLIIIGIYALVGVIAGYIAWTLEDIFHSNPIIVGIFWLPILVWAIIELVTDKLLK